jgi:hypothetical protein
VSLAAICCAACFDLSTGPDEIVAIEFGELPWPSIVAGDTLRDASGVAAPLVVQLFNNDGDVVNGPVEFLLQQKSAHVVAGDLLVIDDTATGKISLFASTTGIQSTTRQIEVVAKPISMALNGTITPLKWVVPDDPNLNTSQPVGARVLSGPNAGVRSWIVTFRLEAGGRVIPASDTTQIFLVGDNGKPSYADTTDTFGAVSRRVRLKVVPGLVPPDSAVITMSASYRGAPLTGSPVRVVLPLSPS